MGASLSDSSVTSATPGVLVKGTVDPTISGGAAIVVQANVSERQIPEQIDASYIENGDTAYWSNLVLDDDGTMDLRLKEDLLGVGSEAGPQFTATALANLWVVLFYGTTSAAWEGAELDNSDMTEPYDFSAASVTAAGPTNNSTLRTAVNADNTVIALLVDGSHPNIDIAALEIADPPEAPTAPTVTSTGSTSISATLSADPTSDSPITSRDIRWKVASADDSTFAEVLGVTSPVSVSGLTANTEYAVQWRANSGAANGTGAWSPSGTATTDSADLMPTVPAIGDIILNHGGTLNFTLPAPISGDPPVTVALTGLASWMSFSPTTRQLTGTAPNMMSSTMLTYTATDTDGDMATRTFSVRVLLGLADFDTSGLETEALGLFQALRQGTNSYVWSRSPHPQGARGSLLDGEMIIGPDNIALNAIRFRILTGNSLGNGRISMESRGVGGYANNLLEDYVLASGLTLHAQSSTLSFSFDVTTHAFDGGTDWARWDLAAADEQAVLASIANGDRFLFALTRPFNNPPTVAIDTSGFTVEPNAVVNITGTVADTEDDNGSLTVTAATTLGTITTPVNTDGTWLCALTAPAGAATTQDMVVTITVEDSGGKTATASETWTVRALNVPNQPAPPTLVSPSAGNLRATWTAPTGGDPADTYDVQYRLTASPDPSFRQAFDVTSPHTIGGLNSGFFYEVQVRGVNAAGNGPWSTSAIERVQFAPLSLLVESDRNLVFGQALDVVLQASRGGFGHRTYTLTPLASWMSFDADSTARRLTGTAPGTPSTTTLTYTVTDESVPPQTASRTFDVTVGAPANLEIAGGTIAAASSEISTAGTVLFISPPLMLSGGAITAASSAIGTTGTVTFAVIDRLELAGGVIEAADAAIGTTGTVTFTDVASLMLSGGTIAAASSAIGTTGTVTFSSLAPLELAGGVIEAASAMIGTTGTVLFVTPPAVDPPIIVIARSASPTFAYIEIYDGDNQVARIDDVLTWSATARTNRAGKWQVRVQPEHRALVSNGQSVRIYALLPYSGWQEITGGRIEKRHVQPSVGTRPAMLQVSGDDWLRELRWIDYSERSVSIEGSAGQQDFYDGILPSAWDVAFADPIIDGVQLETSADANGLSTLIQAHEAQQTHMRLSGFREIDVSPTWDLNAMTAVPKPEDGVRQEQFGISTPSYEENSYNQIGGVRAIGVDGLRLQEVRTPEYGYLRDGVLFSPRTGYSDRIKTVQVEEVEDADTLLAFAEYYLELYDIPDEKWTITGQPTALIYPRQTMRLLTPISADHSEDRTVHVVNVQWSGNKSGEVTAQLSCATRAGAVDNTAEEIALGIIQAERGRR